MHIETCMFSLVSFSVHACYDVRVSVHIDIVLTFFTTPASIEEFKFASLCSSECPTFNNLN